MVEEAYEAAPAEVEPDGIFRATFFPDSFFWGGGLRKFRGP